MTLKSFYSVNNSTLFTFYIFPCMTVVQHGGVMNKYVTYLYTNNTEGSLFLWDAGSELVENCDGTYGAGITRKYLHYMIRSGVITRIGKL